MTKTILDLSDELLMLIAKYINPHYSTPLPSFLPHNVPVPSLNDEDEHPYSYPIRMSKNQDSTNFKLVCKRFKEIVDDPEETSEPLGGLFYELTKGDGIDKREPRFWITTTGEGSRGWERMYFLPNGETTNHWERPSDMIQMRDLSRVHVRWPANPHEVPEIAWNKFIRFLRDAYNLEELHISQLPTCYHDPQAETYPTKSLHPSDRFIFDSSTCKFPPGFELTNLISFHNDIQCRRCHEMANLIVGHSPNLLHLKCTSVHEKIDTKRNPVDPEGYYDDKKDKPKVADYLGKDEKVDKILDKAGFGIPKEHRCQARVAGAEI